ncbi:MAG: hypothetical protein ABR880_15585 [Candidatus Sulfotelmatobacter sp.]
MSTLTIVLLVLMEIGLLGILLRVAVIMERSEHPHGPQNNVARHGFSGVASPHYPKLR